MTFITWARTEGRFQKHFDKDGNPSEELLRSQQERLEHWWMLQELAGIVNIDRFGSGQKGNKKDKQEERV